MAATKSLVTSCAFVFLLFPYSGVAMARGILDSLMSATYFNASALRLLRQLVILALFLTTIRKRKDGAKKFQYFVYSHN